MTKAQREVERIQRVYEGYRDSEDKRRAWSTHNPGNRAILQERQHRLLAHLQAQDQFPLATRRILDIGCGRGDLLTQLLEWGADPKLLSGIDLMDDRIEEARQRLPGVDLRRGSADSLTDPDETFDLVLLFTVMSSILSTDTQDRIATEIRRVLKPGGHVVWYDFRRNNPRNPHVRGVSPQRIGRMFEGFGLDLSSVTVLPPLARRLGPLTQPAYPALARIGWLRTHLLGCLTKPARD